ncbi:MAG: T9SS type A sorting domain-containing protein [bacterium]
MPAISSGQTKPDSLVLRAPDNVFVVPEMNPNRQRFLNWIFWDDIPNRLGTYIHPADTTGWRPKGSETPPQLMSYPISGGVYNGSIDQTVTFIVKNSGEVGVHGSSPDRPDITIRFNMVSREYLNGVLDVGQGYTPFEPLPCVFTNTEEGGKVDFGLTVAFADGMVDSNGVFIIGLEDFEGFHCWRGIERDGSDLESIGEMSKQEASMGVPFDSLYFHGMIPALRSTGVYNLPEPIPGIGDRIDIRQVHPDGKLAYNEFFWVDRNAFNGFTYRYAVTTFDRGYNVKATSQGLTKFDNCPVSEGEPFPCRGELVAVKNELEPGTDLPEVYAVPNPYRSGSSQYTTENYHNFPDNMIRICNVPKNCKVRIYTVSGDLVWEKEQKDGSGVLQWDTRNLYEEEVASGVYILRLESGTGNWVFNRIVIIR